MNARAMEGTTEYEAYELYQTHLLVASAPDDLHEHSDDANSDLSTDSCNSEQATTVGKNPSEVQVVNDIQAFLFEKERPFHLHQMK